MLQYANLLTEFQDIPLNRERSSGVHNSTFPQARKFELRSDLPAPLSGLTELIGPLWECAAKNNVASDTVIGGVGLANVIKEANYRGCHLYGHCLS